VSLLADAGGAARAAGMGQIVMIVDVVDMSTALEAALDEGALAVFGAAPDNAGPPVPVDPRSVGRMAGKCARESGAGLIIVAEPRAGAEDERLARIQKALCGIEKSGVKQEAVLPNLGADISRLASFQGKVVLAVTGAGGVAFDAALKAGAPVVLTGTVARTKKKKGPASAMAAVRRALDAVQRYKRDVAIVAASANAVEDLLAAEYIYKLLLAEIRR
jgi:hypothetical protein